MITMSSDIAAVVDGRDVLLRRGRRRALEAGPGSLAEEMLQQPNRQPRTEAQQAALRHPEEKGERRGEKRGEERDSQHFNI